MNLLQIAQKVHSKVGATGTAPSTVVSARGEWKRIVDACIDGDLEIQALWDGWKFLREEYSQACTPSTATLSAPGSLRMWDFSTFKIREAGDAAGEEYLIDVVEYDDIKSEVLDLTEGIPSRVIVMPDGSLKLEQVPNAAHVILADYYVHPTAMAANSDTSTIPSAYHDVIVGEAIRKYASFEGAGEISEEALALRDIWLPRLENNQLPNKQHSRFNTLAGGPRIEVVGGQ